MSPATLCGVVVHGKHMGRSLGYPTANILPDAGAMLPEYGVYAGEICLEGETQWRHCVINHGSQPTLPSGNITVEVHIMDFDRDIYGARVALNILRRLRDERKFEDVDALKVQLALDEAAARRIFSAVLLDDSFTTC